MSKYPEAVEGTINPTPVPKILKGWKMILGLNAYTGKAHYFVEGRSLCGKWMSLSSAGLEDDNHASPDNCKACMKKREKLVA
jgi:hypothetical protein